MYHKDFESFKGEKVPENSNVSSSDPHATVLTGVDAENVTGESPLGAARTDANPSGREWQKTPSSTRLTDKAKRFILSCNAQFMAPGEVVDMVWESFRLRVTPQQVEYYNPTKSAGRLLKAVYKEYFWAARQENLEAMSNIGIALQVYRLEQLDKLYHRASDKGNFSLCLKILEQAARESGLMYVYNRWFDMADRESLLREFSGLDDARRNSYRTYKRWAGTPTKE